MAGEKKIVGLWRGDAPQEQPAATENGDHADGKPAAEGESSARGWLDPLPADTPVTDALPESPADGLEPSAGASGDGLFGGMLAAAGLGWAVLVGWVASDGGRRVPLLADAPMLGLTLAGPLALLMLVWIARLLSGRVRTRRFAQAAAALRHENAALHSSLAALMVQLDNARAALQEQGRSLQHFGSEAATRLDQSSSGLTASMERIAAVNGALAQSGDTAMQRMEGLLAGLPRVEDVAQRLAENFSAAGRTAHQHGANLEAQLALLTDRAVAADAAVQTLMNQLGGSFRAMESQVEKLCNTVSLRSDAAAAVQKRALGLIAQEQEAIETRVAETLANLQNITVEARERLAGGCEESLTGLETRLASATEVSNALAVQLAAHGGTAETMVRQLAAAASDIDSQLGSIDARVQDRTRAIGDALAALGTAVDGFGDRSARGQAEVAKLLEGSEAVLTAIDAVTRELDESVPGALGRVEASAKAARTLVHGLGEPLSNGADAAARIEAGLASSLAQTASVQTELAAIQGQQDGALAAMRDALGDAQAQLRSLSHETVAYAQTGSADVVASMAQLRDAAANAADEVRRIIAAAVEEASVAMRARASESLSESLHNDVSARLTAIEDASARAVAAANGAAEHLTRQLATIMAASAEAEKRVADAESAIASTDRDTLAKQLVVLTDALKSTAIDLTKILSTEVSDAAWDAYLKGDRGVFSRRAVKLIDSAEAKEILRRYHDDVAFKRHVNQYVHDFEAILRTLMGTRDGSALSVTLLSSDIGKLYVALAQAIDRLRT